MTNEAGGSTVYGYDEFQRLTYVQYPDGISSSYMYDEVGNRLSFLQGNEQIDYSYDFADRLTVTQSVSWHRIKQKPLPDRYTLPMTRTGI
ncbi:hypothetical protein [Ferviditalea candida]